MASNLGEENISSTAVWTCNIVTVDLERAAFFEGDFLGLLLKKIKKDH